MYKNFALATLVALGSCHVYAASTASVDLGTKTTSSTSTATGTETNLNLGGEGDKGNAKAAAATTSLFASVCEKASNLVKTVKNSTVGTKVSSAVKATKNGIQKGCISAVNFTKTTINNNPKKAAAIAVAAIIATGIIAYKLATAKKQPAKKRFATR